MNGLRARVRASFLLLALSAAASAARAHGEDCAEVPCGDCVSDVLNCGGGPSEIVWGYGEYLLWSVEGAKSPPLVTASPANTPLNRAGRLSDNSTEVLYGNQDLDDDFRSGFRVGGGLWLDRCDGLAITADYLWLSDEGDEYSAGPDDGRIITRPFYNTELGAEDAELVDVPNQLSGEVSVDSSSEFEGAGVGLLKTAFCCCDPCSCRSVNLSLLGGYRYYSHESTLDINEDLLVLPGTTSPLVPGTTINVHDRFAVTNEFHGAELGVQGRIDGRKWFVDGLFALALGGTQREVDISGSTTTVVPGGGSSTEAGGLLTSSVTNIGHYEDSAFSIVPRMRLGVGRQLTRHLSVRTGYNVIVWDNVMFADDALPPGLAVDPRNLPPVQAGGGPDPRFPGFGNDSTLLAHGFDFGVQVDF